jgi:hypothetical protein
MSSGGILVFFATCLTPGFKTIAIPICMMKLGYVFRDMATRACLFHVYTSIKGAAREYAGALSRRIHALTGDMGNENTCSWYSASTIGV